MAEDLAPDAVPAPRPVERELGRRPAEPPSVFRGRFALAYLALAVLAGSGLGLTMLLIDRPADSSTVPWSAWKPTGSESTLDDQISDYVGPRYRLPSGNQLVLVLPSRSTIILDQEPVLVRNVVIVNDPEGDRDGFRLVDLENSQMYQLCGLGQQCSIGEGTPTEARMQLLRREALELALYTFKYMDRDSVIALLPPNLGDASTAEDDTPFALFFERKAFKKELEQPLGRTLLRKKPPPVTELDSLENLIVERLTRDRIFFYQFQQAQAGGAIMLLARPSPLG